MPQSLARIIMHIIFSTKNREPMIPGELRTELNAYLGGVLKEFDSPPIEINARADHVHILCCLSRKYALSKVVEEIKKASSKWMKTKSPRLGGFYWQGGYGASSVSQSNVDVVRKTMTQGAALGWIIRAFQARQPRHTTRRRIHVWGEMTAAHDVPPHTRLGREGS